MILNGNKFNYNSPPKFSKYGGKLLEFKSRSFEEFTLNTPSNLRYDTRFIGSAILNLFNLKPLPELLKERVTAAFRKTLLEKSTSGFSIMHYLVQTSNGKRDFLTVSQVVGDVLETNFPTINARNLCQATLLDMLDITFPPQDSDPFPATLEFKLNNLRIQKFMQLHRNNLLNVDPVANFERAAIVTRTKNNFYQEPSIQVEKELVSFSTPRRKFELLNLAGSQEQEFDAVTDRVFRHTSLNLNDFTS